MPSIHSKAHKSYSLGEILIRCEPLVHVISNEFKGEICDFCVSDNCLKKCTNCKQMFYCNRKCQKNDWKSHKLECDLMKSLGEKFDLSTHSRLLLRLYLKIKNDKTIASKGYDLANNEMLSLDDCETHSELIGSEGKEVFGNVCEKLKGLSIDFDEEVLFDLYCKVRRYAIYCESTQISKPHSNDPNLDSNGKLKKSKILCWALFIPITVFTHSCSPNACYVFNGNRIELRVIKPIDVNQEITISYIYLEISKADRNQLLKTYTLDDCKCERCESDFDDSIDYERILSIRQLSRDEFMKMPLNKDELQRYDKKKEVDAIQKEMLDFARKIYGDFSPRLSHEWSQYYIWKVMMELENEENLRKLRDHVLMSYKITHGSNHSSYKKFVELSDTLQKVMNESKYLI